MLLWLGLILVFVGWFTGHTKLGTAVRVDPEPQPGVGRLVAR